MSRAWRWVDPGLVVVDQFGVSAVTDPPFTGQRGAYGDGVDRRPVHRDQLDGEEDRCGGRQQVRAEPYLTQRHQAEEHQGDQTQREPGLECAVKAGCELEGGGVVDPGGQGERQQSAEQHHVGKLQPLRSESGAERPAQEAIFDALAPGGGQSAKSDDERQGEH